MPSTQAANHLIITGTDTNVGKTILSALTLYLVNRFSRRPLKLGYWKPIQTGVGLTATDAKTVEGILTDLGTGIEILPSVFELPEPLSPDQAAMLANKHIQISDLIADYQRHRAKVDLMVIEGAGGILVPINNKQTLGNFFSELGGAVILAARSGLGTLNHSILTNEQLESGGNGVAGIFLIGDLHPFNAKSLSNFTKSDIFELPWFEYNLSAHLKDWATKHHKELSDWVDRVLEGMSI